MVHNEHGTRHPLRVCRVPFVTSSGEMSNFLIEDLELVLKLETIEKYEVPH
jgi:hypothetical protein